MLCSNDGPLVAGPVLLLFLLLAVTASAAEGSPQASEIELLKQQVLELQQRVERLEGELEQGVPVNMARKVEPVPGGWRKAHNWKLLTPGMTEHRVKEVLGEPDRQKKVNKYGFWYYGDGKVSVYMRRLKGWEMPSGIEKE